MLTLHIAYPGEAAYDEVVLFAQHTYHDRLHADLSPHPDLFAYARDVSGACVACFGLYHAAQRELLFETYLPHAFELIAGVAHPERRLFAEFGTRANDIAISRDPIHTDLSFGLTAVLVIAAFEREIGRAHV